MKSEDLFEGMGKKPANGDVRIQPAQPCAETIRKRSVVSIVDEVPESNLFLGEYIEISRSLKLGHWCRADLSNLRQIAQSSADAVLIDSRIRADLAIQSVYFLKKLRPELPVVILDDRPNMAGFMRFLQAGADGTLKIPCTRRSFEEAVQEAINGGKPFSGEIRKRIVEHLAHHFAPANGKRLTQAETEILVGLLDGKRDKEIASDRRTKEGTIHAITNSLYKKLKVHSRAEVVQRFLPLGETFGIVRRLDSRRRAHLTRPPV